MGVDIIENLLKRNEIELLLIINARMVLVSIAVNKLTLQGRGCYGRRISNQYDNDSTNFYN